MLAYNVVFSFAVGVSTSGHLGGLVAGIVIWFMFNVWSILVYSLQTELKLLILR